ncbi:adenylate kinase family protein [Candidatus Woesearchaeota archaeon]|nr:adenylate kinase family protein [Candidatus Woesearchaeota archaeon]
MVPKKIKTVISVTGTPGTGKTSLSMELSKLMGYLYIDPFHFFGKKVTIGYDNIRRTLIVDEQKMADQLTKLIPSIKEPGVVIDSHMSHFLPIKLVTLCIVTRCDLKILKKRLEAKGYSARKVRENLDAEIFDSCLIEAAEAGHKMLVLNTSKASPVTLAKKIRTRLLKGHRLPIRAGKRHLAFQAET